MNSKPNKFLKNSIVILIALNLMMLISLWYFLKPKEMNRMNPQERLITEVGFNENQSSQYKALMKDHKEIAEQFKKQLTEVRKAYFEDITNSNGIGNQELLDKVGYLQEKQTEALFKHFAEVAKLCSNEKQKEKFKKIILRTVSRSGGLPGPHRGREMGPPPPPR